MAITQLDQTQPIINIQPQVQQNFIVTPTNTLVNDPTALVNDSTALSGGQMVQVPAMRTTGATYTPRIFIRTRH